MAAWTHPIQGKYTNKVIIKDNFLDDPYIILERESFAEYYSRWDHPTGFGGYPGVRSQHFHEADEYLFGYVLYKLMPIIKNDYGLNHKNGMYFFSFSKVKKDTYCWQHQDLHDNKLVVAAVIYLNPNPPDPKNNGTKLIIDNKETDVENKFNRLVMYDGDITHCQNDSWGDEWEDDCRLTMNIFCRFEEEDILDF